MKTQSQLGQSHGIDDVLTRRPPGNLVVWCTACPEPGFNMERGWETTSKCFMSDCVLIWLGQVINMLLGT